METELRSGLAAAGLEVEDSQVTALAEAIEAEHGSVSVADVLRAEPARPRMRMPPWVPDPRPVPHW